MGTMATAEEIVHPKAATINEILEFAIEHLASLPVNKAILIQYPLSSFSDRVRESIDEARMIREAANRHGVPVIDTYHILKKIRSTKSIRRNWAISQRGEMKYVANLIARKIPVRASVQSVH
jgi:hypothetical protein